jgi:hypothetical protein
VACGMYHGLPKVGLWRALVILQRHYPIHPKSIREPEVKLLKERISSVSPDHGIAVSGGYGKTCLIDTTASGMRGVINILVRCCIYLHRHPCLS